MLIRCNAAFALPEYTRSWVKKVGVELESGDARYAGVWSSFLLSLSRGFFANSECAQQLDDPTKILYSQIEGAYTRIKTGKYTMRLE
jgi:hypothetical protein